LKDAALKKKLQELGIPHWGKRDLQIRRHTEWVHLWNSNCDASEDNRKTKGELLRELTNWERTRGGWANTSDAPVMRKDFDAKGHIEAHKSQFNELIAAARKKKPSPKEDEKREDAVIQGSSSEDVLMTKSLERSESAAETESKDTTNVLRPYEGNESALLSIREKVQETNLSGNIQAPQHGNEATLPKMNSDSAHSVHTGMQDPFTSPSKRLPMFAVPKEPVMEVEKP
jgi:E3 ubiquitin-protein ligase RAD18